MPNFDRVQQGKVTQLWILEWDEVLQIERVDVGEVLETEHEVLVGLRAVGAPTGAATPAVVVTTAAIVVGVDGPGEVEGASHGCYLGRNADPASPPPLTVLALGDLVTGCEDANQWEERDEPHLGMYRWLVDGVPAGSANQVIHESTKVALPN